MQEKKAIKRPPPFYDLSLSEDSTDDEAESNELSYFDSEQNPILDVTDSLLKYGDDETSEDVQINGQFINEETKRRRNRPLQDISEDSAFTSELYDSLTYTPATRTDTDNNTLDTFERNTRDLLDVSYSTEILTLSQKASESKSKTKPKKSWSAYLQKKKEKRENGNENCSLKIDSRAQRHKPKVIVRINRDFLFIDDEDMEKSKSYKQFGNKKYIKNDDKEKNYPIRRAQPKEETRIKKSVFSIPKYFNENLDMSENIDEHGIDSVSYQKPPPLISKIRNKYLDSDSDESTSKSFLTKSQNSSKRSVKDLFDSDESDSESTNNRFKRKKVIPARL